MKYEYEIREYVPEYDLEETLDELGEEGWDVFQVDLKVNEERDEYSNIYTKKIYVKFT